MRAPQRAPPRAQAPSRRRAEGSGAVLILALLLSLLAHAVVLAAAIGATRAVQRQAADERRVAGFHAAEAGLSAAMQLLAHGTLDAELTGELARASFVVVATWGEQRGSEQELVLESEGEARGFLVRTQLTLLVQRGAGGAAQSARFEGWSESVGGPEEP